MEIELNTKVNLDYLFFYNNRDEILKTYATSDESLTHLKIFAKFYNSSPLGFTIRYIDLAPLNIYKDDADNGDTSLAENELDRVSKMIEYLQSRKCALEKIISECEDD